MATKLRDARTVNFSVSRAELNSVIANEAKRLGLIDFDPDMVEIFDQGNDAFEISFISLTVEIPE